MAQHKMINEVDNAVNVHRQVVTVTPFIDGECVPSQSDASIALFNPSTGKQSLTIPAGCDADIDNAVASARKAFNNGLWNGLAPSKRRQILHTFADLIEAEANELNRLDAIDMGKPVSLAMANASAAANLIRYYSDAIDHVMGDVYRSDSNSVITQVQVPRGVVGAIVPWNFPTMNAAFKFAPALAAGNCVVLKPSEYSPQSAQRLMQLAIDAGIPPGVLNLVPGKGDTVGRALALHNDVDMITFTGSTMVGKLMLQYAGQSNMKLVHAECGGKSPHIVFPDFEDLDVIADNVSQLILVNQGQLCVAGSRLLVHKDIEKLLIDKIADRFSQVNIGDPLDPETTFGPLVSQAQREKVLSYISAGKKSGANLITGGNITRANTGGNFIEPTLFTNVSSGDSIAQEEIFGPVLSVISFNNADEAQHIANATPYGLAAHIWTSNLSTSMKLAKGVRAGMVTVNGAAPGSEWPTALSVEPYAYSGVGTESGLAGLETYLRRQVMWFNH